MTDRMVAELMEEIGLRSIRNDAKRIYEQTRSAHKKDRLKVNFSAGRPDQIWVSDVTCFRLKDKHHYIGVILDLYARKVIAWKISQKHSTQIITSTFKQAYTERRPPCGLIFHSDQGPQYTANGFQELLHTLSVQ